MKDLTWSLSKSQDCEGWKETQIKRYKERISNIATQEQTLLDFKKDGKTRVPYGW